MSRLGKDQLGTEQIGTSESTFEYPEQFENLQETVNPAGPESPEGRMYSHIKPAFRPRDNDKWQVLVEDFAQEFEELADARKEVVVSRYVETAFGRQLDRIGEFVQTPRKTGETDNKYRARLTVNFKQITAGGTIDDFLEVSEVLLSTTSDHITIEEPFDTEPARVDVKVSQNIIGDSNFTIDEYADYLREIKSGGVKLRGVELGGFTHRSEEEYMNGINDIDKSYGNSDYAGLF